MELRAQDPRRTVRAACAPRRQLPGRPQPGRRHRRSGGAPRARGREDARPRRPEPERRRHRREPTRAERRVRARLTRVRRCTGHRHGPGRRRRRGRFAAFVRRAGRRVRRRGVAASGQLRAGARARDVLRGHRLHAARFAHCHGGLRRHRAATAPPAGHARCDRCDREASSTRAGLERRNRWCGRRADRNDRGSRTLVHGRADARARARLSRRPGQLALGVVRHDRRSSRYVAATAAAWWPARAVARVPITRALSATAAQAEARAPLGNRRGRADRCGNRLPRASGRSTPLLIVAGILATILGTLLLGPLAIRLFARAAGHAPIAVRLALRDLARYQARSGAALAAITLALGIAAAVVIVAAAEEKKAAGRAPNLSSRQLRVYTGPVDDPGRSSRSRPPPSSTGWPLAFAGSRQTSTVRLSFRSGASCNPA